jgi:predicted permease
MIIGELLHDLRYGARSLRRAPGFTATVVLSLALGIGANGAIFSLLDGVLLRSLPVREPGRLVIFSDGLFGGQRSFTPEPGRVSGYSYPAYQQLRREGHSLLGVAAQQASRTKSVLRREGGRSELANALAVSASYFSVMGVPISLGRTFLPDDETSAGANPVLILGHDFWQRTFGADPAIVGARVSLNGRPYQVVGVAAPGFAGPRLGEPADAWVPLTMQADLMRSPSFLDDKSEAWLLLYGRLAPGATLRGAEAEVNVTWQRYLADEWKLPEVRRATCRIELQDGIHPLGEVRERFRAPLVALMAGVGLLLLIVCLNVSHLLLARAVHRQREMSIRTALGATRRRLVRQLLVEGLLLSALGAAAALVTSSWLADGLLAFHPGGAVLSGGGGARLWVFIALLGVATTVLLGLVPAWQASGTRLEQALRGTAPAVGSRRRATRILLASQVAFSLVLLVGAELLGGTLARLRALDKGFDEEHVLLVDVIPRFATSDLAQAGRLYDKLLQAVQAIPGVRRASMSHGTGRILGAMTMREGVAVPETGRRSGALIGIVTPGYFETVGMTIVRGRPLGPQDRAGAPLVVVINETLARAVFDATDVVGRRLRYEPSTDEPPADLEVVGVVKDASTLELREGPTTTLFRPVAQAPYFLRSLEVRAAGDPTRLADQVARGLRQAAPELPIVRVRTMSAQLDGALENERLLAALSTGFGLAALFLVCVGLYGVVAGWAAQRTREIGVRMALGATTTGVRWLVLRHALGLVLAGLAVGLPAAVGAARLLRGLLFGLQPFDLRVFVAAAAVLLVVALAAAYLPARRASRLDPMRALNAE